MDARTRVFIRSHALTLILLLSRIRMNERTVLLGAPLEALLRSAASDAVSEDAVRAAALSAGVPVKEFVAARHEGIGATALHVAAAKGNVAAVRVLLQLGGSAVLTTVDRSGASALLAAAAAGHSEVVELLLRGGADPNAADAGGQRALHEAADCSSGARLVLARALLSAGAEPNAADATTAATALHVAAATATTAEAAAMLRLLLESGASAKVRTGPSSADEPGETPLDVALRCRHWAAAAALLGAARINEPLGRFGRCVLHHATMFGDLGAVRSIVGMRGADVDVCDLHGTTSLIVAAGCGHADVAAALLDAAAVIDKPAAGDGQTPLIAAAAAGNADVVRLLLARGADATCVDTSEQSALQYAEMLAYGDCVALLGKK